jgi:hypothetical protein
MLRHVPTGTLDDGMRPDSLPADASVALASGATAGTAGQTDGSALLTAPAALRLRGRLRALTLGPLAGRLALGSLTAGTLLLVVFATGRASSLVPRSTAGFPGWEAGPLHLLFGHPTLGHDGMNAAFSIFILVMMGAYAVALLAVRSLSMRTIVIAVVALNVILLMAPPMQLTDVFNYLGYARLGAVHHLDPYIHTIQSETYDPVFNFSTWHNLRSPYGPLFTAITYPIAYLSLPVAYWVTKVLVVAMSLGFIAAVGWCAKLLGRDPRFAVLFVAANPIYLFYAIGGFHNDFLMLLPSTLAIGLLLARRDRTAGAVLMLAVAVKFTAILLLPFLLIAAVPAQRRLRVLQGCVYGGLPMIALSFALFGAHLPNLHDQSSLLTPFSVPNLFGKIAGVGGGTPTLLKLADVALVPIVLLCLRRRHDWIAGAGYSTLALICTLSWLMPWYIVWVLPLAALGKSTRLRAVTLAFTVFLVLSFLPVTGSFMSDHGINLLNTSAGQASQTLQSNLSK